jgi:hypothetical protein
MPILRILKVSSHGMAEARMATPCSGQALSAVVDPKP